MTLVVGIHGKDDVIWMGADSSISVDGDEYCISNSNLLKVFAKDGFIVGSAGCVRFIKILQNSMKFPKTTDKRGNFRSSDQIMWEFINNLIEATGDGLFISEDNNRAYILGHTIVAWPGNMYIIDGSFAHIEHPYDFAAIGIAVSQAYGALYATMNLNMSSIDRLALTLRTGGATASNVKPPYKILNTNGESFIVE